MSSHLPMNALSAGVGTAKAAGFALLATCLLVAALAVAGFSAPRPAAATTTYSYFPSASATDGRMLAIAGDGLYTLSGSTVTLSFSVASGAPTFLVGFFDGADMSVWDSNQATSFPTRYELYADPLGDGTGTELVATWTDADMTANSWKDFSVTTSPSARTPAGNYSYRLTVSGTTTNAAYNNFKVRVEGLTYITPTSVFGYMGAKASTITTDGSYDGVWDFDMVVPTGTDHFGLWDGDFDYGPSAMVGDTDDPNTPPTPPSWATSSAQNEGAKGVGVPPDDNTDDALRRSPSVYYEVELPDGRVFTNANPSGTTEWEYFRLDTAALDASAMDYHVDSLPPGIYHVRVKGVDWRNLNALRFEFPILSEDASGSPVVPPAPFLVGDRVWDDVTPDGIQGPGETGIAGVKVLLRDPVSGSVVNSATTDSAGAWQMNSWAGSYVVELDATNFATGGALSGYEFTTPSARAITIAGGNRLDADFGVRLTPALSVMPDRFATACPGGSVAHTFTVRNMSGTSAFVSLSSLPGLGWPTEIRNSAGEAVSAVPLASGESTSVTLWMSVPLGTTIGSRDVTQLDATVGAMLRASAIAETLVRSAVDVMPDQAGFAGAGSSVDYAHTVINSSATTQSVSLSATDVRGWAAAIYDADGTTPRSSVTLPPNGGSADFVVRVTVPAGTAKDTTSSTTVTAVMGSNTDTATDTTAVRALVTFADAAYATPASRFDVGATVYARASGLTTNRTHTYTWKDPSGATVRTSTATRPNSSGVLGDSYALPADAAAGTWTIEVRRGGTLVETTTFEVVQTAAITSLYGTNAAAVGSVTSVGSTSFNSGSASIGDARIEYVIWWDADADGVFDAGDIAIDASGAPVSFGASTVTHTSTGIALEPRQTFSDADWSVPNAQFPARGTYQVTATLKTSAGATLDTKTTSFFSVPTLGEGTVPTLGRQAPSLTVPLVLAAVVIWAIALVRFWSRRSWLLFYGLGALGTVVFALLLSQALGLDDRLAAFEAAQVAAMARVLNLRIEHVSATGLAIRNHIGWGVFDIGIECSALLELASFVGLAVFYPTFRPGRKAGIVALGLTATYTINLLRILLIVGMIAVLGTGWVFFAHAVVGRVFFFVGVVAILWFLMTRPTVGVVRGQLEEGRNA